MGSDSFTTPGSSTWNKPSGLDFIRFRVAGAIGSDGTVGIGTASAVGTGGDGHLVVATNQDPTALPSSLEVFVGGDNGGFNGGATSPASTDEFRDAQGGPSGGASDVRTSTNIGDRFVVGGGGAGGGAANADDTGSGWGAGDGGDAGLPDGQDGGDTAQASGGAGGTQSTGNAQPDGASGTASGGSSQAASGGSGGGGYWGGFGGGAATAPGTGDDYAYAGGGGAGSSFYDDTLVSLDTTSAHTSGDGFVEILYIGAPSNLTVTSHDADSITLDWDAATAADAYQIYRATSSGLTTGDYTAVDTTPTVGYTDTGLLNGEQYYYRVTALDTANSLESDVTSEVNQLTDLPAPTNLTHPSVGDTTADYDWTANANNGDIRVEYKDAAAGSWTTFSTVSNTTEAETVTGLLMGNVYDSRVVAETEHTEAVDT